jgi:hypothetical protein
MSERMYIHETINISVDKRSEYLAHFTDVWAPTSRRANGLTCFGVWATNGSTGVWPEAVVMWELESKAAFSRMMGGEFAHLHDPDAELGSHYDLYWGSAPEGVVARDGFDRLLAPTPATLSLAETIAAGRKGAIYYHQVVTTKPGRVEEYLERHDSEWRPLAEEHGLVFIGSYRTMLGNDSEAVVLWGLPEHHVWERIDGVLRRDDRAVAFRRATADVGVDWKGTLLIGAPANPLDTGEIL